MYFIFDAKLLSYKGSNVQAKLLNPLDWETGLKWRYGNSTPLQLLSDDLPVFRFEVKQHGPQPDNYWTGAGVDLFSERLIRLLDQSAVQYQSFITEIQERSTTRRVLDSYKVFRPLEVFPLINLHQSIISDDGARIKKLVLDQEIQQEGPIMFLDSNFRELLFVRDDLKLKIEQQTITGCRFRTIDEYVHELTQTHTH
jgi:hypothetical protein